jgi:biopolymer transport protein ExbB
MNLSNGLFNVWAQGDAVTRCVLVLLLAMSLASWMVIVLKTLDLRRLSQQARQLKSFWHASDFDAGLKTLNGEANPFHALALEGRQAAAHLSDDHSASAELHEGFNLSDWLTRSLTHSIDDATAELQSGLAILASVGSTAPFVGLFGTVWGIYHALMAIGLSGQATIDKVAGPIGETLIMTALGLAVAIPAVLGYNALVRGNKGVLLKLNRFAHDLHAFFVTGARVGAR